MSDELDETYGYCNSCGEEMWMADDCCDDGEWEPYDAAGPLPQENTEGET